MNDLHQRTFWTLLQNAIFSPLSGLLVAAAIVLVGLGVAVPVLNAPPLAWLLALVPAWVIAVVANVVTKQAGEQAVLQELRVREQYDLNRIANPHLRTVVSQAIAYRERIDKATGQFASPVMRGQLQDVANQVEDWVGRIYTLAWRLDAYRHDALINAELSSVPEAIRQLQARLGKENDPAVKQEIQDAIVHCQTQLSTLRSLDNATDRAELQLENALTSLGTVYSQLLLLDARDVDSSKAQRLRESIASEVASLQDIQTALDEVYETGNQKTQPNVA
jgi:hypothetical protein